MHEDPTYEKRFNVTSFVIMSGWIVAIVVAAIMVLAVVYLNVNGHEVPSPLKELVSGALTFLFVSFVPLVKEFMNGKAV